MARKQGIQIQARVVPPNPPLEPVYTVHQVTATRAVKPANGRRSPRTIFARIERHIAQPAGVEPDVFYLDVEGAGMGDNHTHHAATIVAIYETLGVLIAEAQKRGVLPPAEG